MLVQVSSGVHGEGGDQDELVAVVVTEVVDVVVADVAVVEVVVTGHVKNAHEP